MRFFVLLFTIFAAPIWAQNAPVTTFTLSNGMEAVVIEDHRAPIATHMVWYRVGAADEAPGKSGIAHFLEHLMFNATDDIAPGDFSRIIESLGGNDNAFTSSDYTGYFQNIAVEHLELMMQMEADRMRDLVLTNAAVEVEREVVLAERNQRTDSDPASLFSEQRNAAQFMNHPYGIPIIGWRHEIETLDLEDAVSFYEQYYAPNNAILVVAGDVDPIEVEALANKHYGPLEPSDGIVERARPQEPPHLSPRRLSFADPRVSNPYVIRTYIAPERNSGDQQDAAALLILSELLGGNGLTSVLGRKLQIEEQIAVSTSAFYSGTSLDPDTFGFVVIPNPEVSLEDAEAALDEVIAEFLENGPDPAHLARIKSQVSAAQIYARDDMSGLARRYGTGLVIGLTVEDIAAWPDILAAVTADDILAVATTVLTPENSVTGWLLREDTQ